MRSPFSDFFSRPSPGNITVLFLYFQTLGIPHYPENKSWSSSPSVLPWLGAHVWRPPVMACQAPDCVGYTLITPAKCLLCPLKQCTCLCACFCLPSLLAWQTHRGGVTSSLSRVPGRPRGQTWVQGIHTSLQTWPDDWPCLGTLHGIT